jgi:hypothetical protein
MTHAPAALPTPTVLDYERTLILAIELRHMAGRTLRRTVEDCLAPFERSLVV